MLRLWRASWPCLLILGSAFAQTSKTVGGYDLQVELSNRLTSNKAKVGDVVTTVTRSDFTLSNGTKIPAGSKVVGHVRKVESEAGGGHNSSIALSFDEIDLKAGQRVALSCFVRAAVMPALKGTYAQESANGQNLAPVATTPRDAPDSGRMGMAGPGVGDVNNAQTQTSSPSANRSNTDSSPVTVHAGQVLGMPGVELSVSGPDRLSTFRSTHKNLELDSGLQLMLWVMQ